MVDVGRRLGSTEPCGGRGARGERSWAVLRGPGNAGAGSGAWYEAHGLACAKWCHWDWNEWGIDADERRAAGASGVDFGGRYVNAMCGSTGPIYGL